MKKNKETTVKDIIDIVLPKIGIMLLVGAILAVALATYSAFFKKDTYTSSSLVYVYNDKGSASLSTSDLQAAEEMVNVYKVAITGEKYLLYVCSDERLASYDLTPNAIASMLSIQQVDETPAFKISVTSTNPQLVYDVASVITDRIAVYVQGENGLIRNALQSSILADPALAQQPNSKNIVRNTIIAFLAGFILSAVVIWVYSTFDVIIKSSKKIEDNLDIPILGIIPEYEIEATEEVKV